MVSELSLRPTHVRTCGDGVAVVYAVWELTGQRGIDDQVLAPRKGVLTTLLERRDGGWLIQTYHETAVANPQRTVAPGRAGE